MSARIEALDKGMLSGTSTWHGLPQYELVGNRAVTAAEAETVVDFPIAKVPTYLEMGERDALGQQIKSGAYAIVRTDQRPAVVLAPAVGARYEATPHRQIFNQMTENLLASFPDLKICGTGTLENGRTWWIQMVAAKFFVKGDQSENELRLCYHQSYGKTAHSVYASVVRIVCNNTLRAAESDAVAKQMISRFSHTKSARAKINANLDLMAQLHLGLEKHKELMEELASKPVTAKDVELFLGKFLPEPKSDAKVSESRHEAAVAAFNAIFVSGQSMDASASRSRYAVLQAYVDYLDHQSYTRDDSDRWFDAQDGVRAATKQEAATYLQAI